MLKVTAAGWQHQGRSLTYTVALFLNCCRYIWLFQSSWATMSALYQDASGARFHVSPQNVPYYSLWNVLNFIQSTEGETAFLHRKQRAQGQKGWLVGSTTGYRQNSKIWAPCSLVSERLSPAADETVFMMSVQCYESC